MRRLLLTLLMAAACDAHALALRLCTLDHPFPPHTMPDGSGLAQVLVRQAATEEGIAIENTVAPRLRCINMRKSGVKVDEGAKTIEQNLEKLAQGRVQAMVALEGEAQPLIDRHFAGRIEVLPKALDVTPMYLHVHPAYYAGNREAVEKLWNTLRRTRESAAFQQSLKR